MGRRKGKYPPIDLQQHPKELATQREFWEQETWEEIAEDWGLDPLDEKKDEESRNRAQLKRE